jgi:hypothetical protein
MELGVATCETTLSGALELGGRALSLAEASGRAVLLGAAFSAEALVLGALQREDTLRMRSPARFDQSIERRLSTGTEAQISGSALYHALALPGVSSLFPDASSRTLLNRNLRALLRGYTAAGVPLRYFGTEVLALLGRPVALVGYEQLASGAVLIEVLIGLEEACVVRSALKREPPAALYALLRSRPEPFELLQRAQRGISERLSATSVDVTAALDDASASRAPRALGSAAVSRVAIPVGVVEGSLTPHARLSGDLLVSAQGLAAVERAADSELAAGRPLSAAILAPLEGWALDGARPADLLAALSAAPR